MEFKTKEDYLFWRAEWRAEYKALSQLIRDLKKDVRCAQPAAEDICRLLRLRARAREAMVERTESKEAVRRAWAARVASQVPAS